MHRGLLPWWWSSKKLILNKTFMGHGWIIMKLHPAVVPHYWSFQKPWYPASIAWIEYLGEIFHPAHHSQHQDKILRNKVKIMHLRRQTTTQLLIIWKQFWNSWLKWRSLKLVTQIGETIGIAYGHCFHEIFHHVQFYMQWWHQDFFRIC